MLGQVISHLLANAVDAMPRGGRLTLATERLLLASYDMAASGAGPEEFVCLTIADTGCGISPSHLSRICEPFFTTKDAPDRSGLGLAFVYGTVKRHHGWTEVSSKMGEGTTFKICLPSAPTPVALAQADSAAHSQRPTRLLAEPRGPGRQDFPP